MAGVLQSGNSPGEGLQPQRDSSEQDENSTPPLVGNGGSNPPASFKLPPRLGRRKDLLGRTSQPDSLGHGLPGYPHAPCCLLHRNPLAAHFDEHVTPGVVALLFCGSPLDVPRFVIAIVIHTVDRVLRRRSRSNVVQKTLEGIQPGRIDSNAATAVIGIRRMPLTGAAPDHCFPAEVSCDSRLGASHAISFQISLVRAAAVLPTPLGSHLVYAFGGAAC